MTPDNDPSPAWIRGVLLLHALSFLGFGMWGIVSPYTLLDIVELAPDGPAGVIDVRATYGGLVTGVGVALSACILTPGWTRPGLAMGAATYGGFALGRGMGMLMAVDVTTLQAQIALVEAFMCALALAALWAGRPRPDGALPPAPPSPTGVAPTV